jgi:hypothetical protein
MLRLVPRRRRYTRIRWKVVVGVEAERGDVSGATLCDSPKRISAIGQEMAAGCGRFGRMALKRARIEPSGRDVQPDLRS